MYAFHSFAATVEGQANATKGDMLVLLDDSNSYWWLVRVVKDSTVGRCLEKLPLLTASGYLPAETIETPQERLARLNKHRNIDVNAALSLGDCPLICKLTAVMLEDHSPSRSSSRRPFRRRGAKTVIFNNSCTYYQIDSTSYDTSDGEEEDEDAQDPIEVQMDSLDQPSTEIDSQTKNGKLETNGRLNDGLAEMEALIDAEVDSPLSPRFGIETMDVSGSLPDISELFLQTV